MQFEEQPALRQTPVLTERLRSGLQVLLQAHTFSACLKRDLWDFAVEAWCLFDLGITTTELRWLICEGLVVHATEISDPAATSRSFRPQQSLELSPCCCFVLTPAGVRILELQSEENEPVRTTAEPTSPPAWDKLRRTLRFRDRIVKEFKVPAPNQEVILSAFEEEFWPCRIDDPLPMVALLDPKRRLHDTINSLNRNQRIPMIRFLGDGNGEGILWEPVANA